MVHHKKCKDKSELIPDLDGGPDSCLNCGGVIEDNDDQLLLQENFFSMKPKTDIKEAFTTNVLSLDVMVIKECLEQIDEFYMTVNEFMDFLTGLNIIPKTQVERIKFVKMFKKIKKYLDKQIGDQNGKQR